MVRTYPSVVVLPTVEGGTRVVRQGLTVWTLTDNTETTPGSVYLTPSYSTHRTLSGPSLADKTGSDIRFPGDVMSEHPFTDEHPFYLRTRDLMTQ